MNRATRRAFDQAAGALIAGFEQAGPFTGQEVTPHLLADAVRQCLDVCQRADAADEELPADEVDELGTHALECLSDLGLWAWQLRQDEARAAVEDTALELAHWLIGRGGRIAVLEPVVNALARQANATRDGAALARLHDRALAVIAHAAPGVAGSSDPAAAQPWLMLHFNCAIIATRTQQTERMNASYDLLEANLPQHCAAFFAEGVRESAKTAYGAHVGDMMRERLAKWTARH